MRLLPPTNLAESLAAELRSVAVEGIDASAPTWQRLSRASGALDTARLKVEADVELHAPAARAAVEAAGSWLDSIGSHDGSAALDRAGTAVIAAARRRMQLGLEELDHAVTRARSSAPAAARHLQAARDLVDGVAAYQTGALGSDTTSRAIARATAHDIGSAAARSSLLLRSSNGMLDAGFSDGVALTRGAEELVAHRVGRATQALHDLAEARDIVRASPASPERDALDAGTTRTIQRVLASMAEGLPTMRFSEAANDAATLADRAVGLPA
jgi:hypothetical protein